MISSKRCWWRMLIVVAILAVSLSAVAGLAAAPEERFQQAMQAIDGGKFDAGLTILHALASDPKLGRDERLRAFWKIIEIHTWKTKDVERGIAATKEMILAFPSDNVVLQQVYFSQANLLSSARKWKEAVDAYHQVVAHAPNDAENAVTARFQAAGVLRAAGDFAQLHEEATQLLHLLQDDPRATEALLYISDAAWQTGHYEECLEVTRRNIAEYPHASYAQNHWAHFRVIDCLQKLNKPHEIRASYEDWEKKDPDAHWRQRCCYSAGDCCLAEKDNTAALAAYRRVIAGHCDEGISDCWYDAQSRIVDLLRDSGDLKAALQEAHVLFDAARPDSITWDTLRIADLFARLDKNRDRADRFITYQCYGPDGPDGKPGNEDDLSNPLDEIGYPADRDRQQAFVKAFAHLGNDAAATHHRGMICLYAGQPKDALYYFMDAFRRSDSGKFQDYAISLVVNGLRGVRGHSIGLSDAVRYILYGPGGEGGKPGAPDALQDPFKAYASLTPMAPFTVPPVPGKDMQLLKKLQASLTVSTADTTWPSGVRLKAFSALARLNEALNAWPANAGWYRNLLLTNTDAGLSSTILNGAISASKGNVLHLGNVRAFLASLNSFDTAGNKVVAGQVVGAGKNFQHGLNVLEQLQKVGSLAPKVDPPREGKH